MATDKYARVIRLAMTQPWAIDPQMAATIADVLRFRASGGRFTADELRARIGAATDEEPPKAHRQGQVAVIPIWGVIAHRTFEASSGMTSTEVIGRWLQRAVADDEVTHIVLDIASPGGMVSGTPELAAAIFAARKAKAITAIANAQAASAAYWLGSQAQEFSITPSGEAGSIGVYMLTEDWSEYLAKEGIKINPISAGEHKLEGNFWEPMSDETRTHFQAQVDATYADFLKAVARGRALTSSQVKKNFGGGRVFDADEAKSRGMVDRIETFDELIARTTGGMKRRGSARAARADRDVASASAESSPEDDCPTCGGCGFQPEGYMGDPAGQEPCPDCGGSGKAQSSGETAGGAPGGSAAAPSNLAADQDAINLALALLE